jgi:hypothetical protein
MEEVKQLKEAGKRLLALFQDQEIDHPAAFGEFRKAFGYTEEPIPDKPIILTPPEDDQIFETVKQFEANKHVLATAFDRNRELRDEILKTMGEANMLRFASGTTVKRKVVERGATSTGPTKYDTIRVDLRGKKT